MAGGILGPHVETARGGVIGASSRLVKIHDRVQPVLKFMNF
jgi:hypothetical protein